MAISPDDQKIAVGYTDGTLSIFSLKTNVCVELESKFKTSVTNVSFYPFKKSVIAASDYSGGIQLWDINLNQQSLYYKPHAHKSQITGLAFPPCNKHFYCSVVLMFFM
jgi:WD40 repeat protein